MISINSDDPSVFNTNVSNEFAYVFYSLQEKGYSREDALLWIDKVRKYGMESSFIDDRGLRTEELLKEYLVEAKENAKSIAYICDELFKDKLIEGPDFHTFLLAVQNLIEYLNSKYFRDFKIEEEVKTMTKTLYDPEVERRAIEKEKENSRLKDIGRVKRLLTKKFGALNNDFNKKIEDLDSDKLNLIIENILDLENLEEVKKHF